MNFIVKFSPRAEETYDAIATQLRQRLGEKFVVKLKVKMRKNLSNISTSPIHIRSSKKLPKCEDVYFIKTALCFTKYTKGLF